MIESEFVDKKFQEEALKVLKQRMSKGEKLLQILNIREEFSYYADKIAKGLTPMSYTM